MEFPPSALLSLLLLGSPHFPCREHAGKALLGQQLLQPPAPSWPGCPTLPTSFPSVCWVHTLFPWRLYPFPEASIAKHCTEWLRQAVFQIGPHSEARG